MNSSGPLSWQQAVMLRKEQDLQIRTGNVAVPIPLPDDEPAEQSYERLAAIARREDVLRITALPADVTGTVTYADEIELPFSTARAGTAEQLSQMTSEFRRRPFGRDNGPLWRMVVIEHPDRAGRSARTGCAVFDHFIADARSALLFRDEITGQSGQSGQGRNAHRGRYRDWVAWQHDQFPMSGPADLPTPARDFWRRYFDGSAPNRALDLPFCDPSAPLSGLEHAMYRHLPISTAELRAAAGRLSSTPFLMYAGSVVAAVGAVANEQDISLRYATHGRPLPYIDTLGWFSDNFPLRVRGACLGDPRQALSATAQGWSELLGYETTPWGYILRACSETDSERSQIVINFVQYPGDRMYDALPEDQTVAGSRGTLNMSVQVPSASTGRVECRFDPERFDRDGVDDFVRVVFDTIRKFAAA